MDQQESTRHLQVQEHSYHKEFINDQTYQHQLS